MTITIANAEIQLSYKFSVCCSAFPSIQCTIQSRKEMGFPWREGDIIIASAIPVRLRNSENNHTYMKIGELEDEKKKAPKPKPKSSVNALSIWG